jgi:sigma-B regulation protein RsbU (phosphoserine phosphatase)
MPTKWRVSMPACPGLAPRGAMLKNVPMHDRHSSYLRLFGAQLSRRIVVWVFFSVVIIETIIFFPSLKNREQELLGQLREISSAKIGVLMQVISAETTDEAFLLQTRKLLKHSRLVGVALYRRDGTEVGVVGERPELSFQAVTADGVMTRIDRRRLRYDVACLGRWQRVENILVVRHDTTEVKHELVAFFFRIAGLVVIISIFVTGGALMALGPIVVTPILRLRRDLIAAGEAVSRDLQAPEFHSSARQRSDELGEVITAFREMFTRITEAISRRKEAEKQLTDTLRTVEAYSRELKRELETGREMQQNFLPAGLIQPPGWELAAYFRPARQVAGDYYDVFELPGGRLGLVIADVCDKGVGAALFMALFRSLIRIFAGQFEIERPDGAGAGKPQPSAAQAPTRDGIALRAVALTNRYVAGNHGDLGMFASLFFGVLDTATGELDYINAGHEPLVVLHPLGGIRTRLKATGPVVGIRADARFASERVRLLHGETLLGFTDGVPEASAPSGEFFGHERLTSLLDRPVISSTRLIGDIAERVLAHTGEAEQFDDITLLAIRGRGELE